MSEEQTFIPEPLEEEEDDSVLEMIDEDGNVTQVRVEASIELDGHTYLALADIPDDEEDEEAEVAVSFVELIDEDAEDAEEALRPVEDDALLEKLFQQFLDMIDAEEDAEE